MAKKYDLCKARLFFQRAYNDDLLYAHSTHSYGWCMGVYVQLLLKGTEAWQSLPVRSNYGTIPRSMYDFFVQIYCWLRRTLARVVCSHIDVKQLFTKMLNDELMCSILVVCYIFEFLFSHPLSAFKV